MYSGQTRSIHFLGQVAVESHEGSEEPTIDQARIMGRPDRRPAQGENVEFFLSQINFSAEISISLTVWSPRNNREERDSKMQALTLLLSDLWQNHNVRVEAISFELV